ncbi:AraC family transcriptional regulator [Ruegeria sp. PrR005]|uniref:AraC family transcriptional regulator n=1 Tax=Ruegeria sp. PrR005 TaxID=2706882 RepID=A0A6B2NKV8_9RHOB|nr:AraC family transcriptional regulator [Ruegeria sp. PrR005]NDW44666.1 AraC family transcriptional regulator [Ruegeria sp. PrR005]
MWPEFNCDLKPFYMDSDTNWIRFDWFAFWGHNRTMNTKNFPFRQRATILAHLPPLLAELGVPLGQVFEGTGIAPDDLVPNAFLPYAGVTAMLDRATEVSGREDLSVLLAQRQTLAALGPAGQVMCHAATLGEALNDYAQFQIWNSTGAAAYVYQTPDDFVFGYGIYDPDGVDAIHIHDLVLAAGCMLVFLLTERQVQPIEIWSMRPPPKDPKPFERFAGCPVFYGRDQSCILLSPAAAGFQLADADSKAHSVTLAQLAARTTSGSWGTTGAVRHALRAAITTGRIGMPEIAARLQQHPRSLRRALEREGTSFTAQRNEVRYIVARELLSLTALPIGDVALALNFADISAFTHAFRMWSGTSPTEWRRIHNETLREG